MLGFCPCQLGTCSADSLSSLVIASSIHVFLFLEDFQASESTILTLWVKELVLYNKECEMCLAIVPTLPEKHFSIDNCQEWKFVRAIEHNFLIKVIHWLFLETLLRSADFFKSSHTFLPGTHSLLSILSHTIRII